MIGDKVFLRTTMGLAPLSSLSAAAEIPAAIHAPSQISEESSLERFLAEQTLAPKLLPMGTFVGELGEKWQFPSDHLPIGITLDGLHIASWNVMNSKYYHWVETNGQGLAKSLIAKEHVYIGRSGLTLRDKHNIDLILNMISHPTHPKSLISLQECSFPFLKELEKNLPPQMKIVREQRGYIADQNAVIYDSSVLTLKNAKTIYGIFSKDERPFQEILFDNKGENLRILNAHVPGDFEGPARYEFALYLTHTITEFPTIAMGDMNFNEFEMQDALREAYAGSVPGYQIHTPYCTNIDPRTRDSKAIDHFIINGSLPILHIPGEVLEGLGETVSLLDGK